VTLSPEPKRRKPRSPVDVAGAEYTALVAAQMTRLRGAKGWTPAALAAEMTTAGVPWTRETVVNLERGRKKSLGVHELLALAWVLDANTPLDLLAPNGAPVRVTPGIELLPVVIRAWFRGSTGPLKAWLSRASGRSVALVELAVVEEMGIDLTRRLSERVQAAIGQPPPPAAEPADPKQAQIEELRGRYARLQAELYQRSRPERPAEEPDDDQVIAHLQAQIRVAESELARAQGQDGRS
jgi:hypothetical protein